MRVALLWLSLATIVFAWVTMRISVDQVDGPLLQYYGFPLPYRRWSQFSSLHDDIDLIAVAVDYATYLAACGVPLAIRRLRAVARTTPGWLLSLLWTGALVSLLLSFGGGIVGSLHAARFPARLRVVESALYVGVGFPY